MASTGAGTTSATFTATASAAGGTDRHREHPRHCLIQHPATHQPPGRIIICSLRSTRCSAAPLSPMGQNQSRFNDKKRHGSASICTRVLENLTVTGIAKTHDNKVSRVINIIFYMRRFSHNNGRYYPLLLENFSRYFLFQKRLSEQQNSLAGS